jgi:hypothetical protein
MHTPESHDLARIDQELTETTIPDLELEIQLAQLSYTNKEIEALAKEYYIAGKNGHLEELVGLDFPEQVNLPEVKKILQTNQEFEKSVRGYRFCYYIFNIYSLPFHLIPLSIIYTFNNNHNLSGLFYISSVGLSLGLSFNIMSYEYSPKQLRKKAYTNSKQLAQNLVQLRSKVIQEKIELEARFEIWEQNKTVENQTFADWEI